MIYKIIVEADIEFSSGALTSSVKEEYRREFLRDDNLRLGFSCINYDCVGGGFSLKSEVERAIKSCKDIVEGSKKCCGKEDNKYRSKERGCSCDSIMNYKITIIYQER